MGLVVEMLATLPCPHAVTLRIERNPGGIWDADRVRMISRHETEATDMPFARYRLTDLLRNGDAPSDA